VIEHGGRKSLQPTLFRLEETPARYESMQQFLADSPWEPDLVVRACAERVAPELGVLAWVVDDTGIVKDGRHSPGVKRQYSGTLGKIGNCQITVSVHAVGGRGTLPLGFALYLPEEWCDDAERRQKAKIPDEVVFETKPQLASSLVEQASGWRLPSAPILHADQITRLAGLDPVVDESGARRAAVATSPRPAHRIFAGRSSKRPCTRTAQPPPTSPSTAPPASGATRPWRD
jgi:hypothetical protein